MNRISEISFPENNYCEDFIISEDEKSIYVVTNWARVCKYNIETGAKTAEINFDDRVYNYHFGSRACALLSHIDTNMLSFVIADRPQYKLFVANWNETSIEICSLKYITNNIISLEWSPTGERIALGFDNGTVKMYNKKDDTIELFFPDSTRLFEQKFKFSQDGRRLIVVANDVSVWDVQTKQCLNRNNFFVDWTGMACFCPTNSSLVGLSSQKSLFTLWNVDTNEVREVKRNHRFDSSFKNIHFLPKERFFFGTCLETVKIYDSVTCNSGTIFENALSRYCEADLASFCKSTKFAISFYKKICFYDLLNRKFIIHNTTLLLKRGAAPYICLDIANFLLADQSTFNFQLTSDLMHFEKIQLVSNWQSKLLM